MNYIVGQFPLVRKQNLSINCWDFLVYCPEVAAFAKPGQFCHLKAEGFALRRPISICEIDRKNGTVRLVFEVRGDGTQVISNTEVNGTVDMIAPLGNGFTILPEDSRAIAVGGGIGVPPMLETIKRYGKNGTAVLGFRSKDAVILVKDFMETGAQTILCTDDGTDGQKGFVTLPLQDILQQKTADIVYACGPRGMLKGVVSLCEKYGVRCEVSLEERMGCGIGACLVCACKCVKNGREFYAHVCTDGPVFNAKEVSFDE